MTAIGPRRRAFIRAGTGLVHRGWRLLLVPVLLIGIGCALRSRPDRPDLILVVIDTLRADHLPIYGYDRDTSPSFSAIAAHGLVFERAFAHSSWTLPSMGSLLTGRYPSETGLTRRSVDQTQFGTLRGDVTTLAGVLSRRGYRTAAFVNNTFLAPEVGLRRGFDHYDYDGASN